MEMLCLRYFLTPVDIYVFDIVNVIITCASFKFKSPPLAHFSILNYNTRK